MLRKVANGALSVLAMRKAVTTMNEQLTGSQPEHTLATAPTRHNPGWGWRDLLAAGAVTIIGTALVIIAARGAVALFGLPRGDRLVSPLLYLVGVSVYLVALLGVYLFAARKAGWAALGLRRFSERAVLLIPLVFILQLSALLLVNLLVTEVQGSFENPQVEALTGGRVLGGGELIMLLLLVAGLVPFVEELVFRGMLYPLLRARMPVAAAIACNGGLFALAHVIPQLLPGLFVVGICLAYLRERSGSLWPSVIAHAMQNGMALLLINLALSSGQL